MRQGACTIDDLDEYGCAPIHNEDDKACENWCGIELPLEQRYQQLEQMTKRLYRYIKKDADESWSPVKEKVARNFHKELKAIGVEL